MTEGTRLAQVSRCLNHLLQLRSAFAPFRAAVESTRPHTLELEDRRQVLTLWRPCQRRLDRLLDTAPTCETTVLDPLRQEIEDSLRDEVISTPALVELTRALDQTCEALLLRLGENLRAMVGRMEEQPVWEGGTNR